MKEETDKQKSNYPGKQSVYRPSGETRMKGTAYIKDLFSEKIRETVSGGKIETTEFYQGGFWYEEKIIMCVTDRCYGSFRRKCCSGR